MSQKSEHLPDSGEKNKAGPDFFGYYTSEVAELLYQDGGLRLFSDRTSNDFGREKGKVKNSFRTKENNGNGGSASLYSNGIGALLSECKKERLKSVLRQSVFTLTEEVDEMIDPVLSLCRILSCLRYKESLLNLDASACKADHTENTHKKRKVASPPSSILNTTSGGGEIDDDLRFLLENDSTAVEELMKKHSSEFLTALQHMEQKLEELLNIVMTSCRPMTLAEKQHLRKDIQNLPPKNLDHVVGIIGRNKPTDKYSSDEVHVDLDEEVVMWNPFGASLTFFKFDDDD